MINLNPQDRSLRISADNIMDPEPRLPETEIVTAGPFGASTVYGCWGSFPHMQWIALGGQSTCHTEALRIVSGSDTAIHPAGWPVGELKGWGTSALKLTASDLAALAIGLETEDDQAEMCERRYGRGSCRGEYGNGY